jgi:transposase InsO family protein
MAAGYFPLQYLIAVFALWLNRQQQEVIDYLKEENRLLKEKLGDRKLHFTDAERRRLAARAKLLGRKILAQLDTLVTPDTLLRWQRELIAQKWNHVHKRKLIIDRDKKYCAEFRDLLVGAGCEIIRLPPRSPNLNAHAERRVGSIKSECLNRLIFFGEASLRRARREYLAHYHCERNHQGLNNRLPIESANDCDCSRACRTSG